MYRKGKSFRRYSLIKSRRRQQSWFGPRMYTPREKFQNRIWEFTIGDADDHPSIPHLLEFSLYPYAIRQMIQKVLSVTEGFTEEKQSLNEMVKLAGEELAERVAISYGQAQIDGRIQPILYALIKKTEAEDENALLAVFRAGAKRSMDEIKLSPAEFSLQLCRELELIRCSVKEQ